MALIPSGGLGMDLISLYYFTELAKDMHITRTAGRLFISQQTLSSHIRRLEEHYGTKLLNRKPTLSLTCAGAFVLDFAKLVIKEESDLENQLSDIGYRDCGTIRFGASTLRLSTCLPDILEHFSLRYPNVEFQIADKISSQLEPMVLNGELDFAMTIADKTHASLESQYLMDDQIYLCVADSLLQKYYGDQVGEDIKERSLNGADLRDFARLPFCLYSNRMGNHIMKCFASAQVKPNTYMRSTFTQIGTEICFRRLAACFLPHMRLVGLRKEIPADINIFPLYDQGKPIAQKVSLIRRKDQELPYYARYFQDLLHNWFTDVEYIRMTRKGSES